MKKYIGAFASGLAGILTFVFLSLDGLFAKASAGGLSTSSSTSGWDILKDDGSNIDGYTLYKIAVIAMIVIACLLILSAVVIFSKMQKCSRVKQSSTLLTTFCLHCSHWLQF